MGIHVSKLGRRIRVLLAIVADTCFGKYEHVTQVPHARALNSAIIPIPDRIAEGGVVLVSLRLWGSTGMI